MYVTVYGTEIENGISLYMYVVLSCNALWTSTILYIASGTLAQNLLPITMSTQTTMAHLESGPTYTLSHATLTHIQCNILHVQT